MKAIIGGIGFVLLFLYAACVDGIADQYGMGTLMVSGVIVIAVVGLCILISNLPSGGAEEWR